MHNASMARYVQDTGPAYVVGIGEEDEDEDEDEDVDDDVVEEDVEVEVLLSRLPSGCRPGLPSEVGAVRHNNTPTY